MPAFPTGWYFVAKSRDIQPGRVAPVRRLGRELVLFRDRSGQATLIDAHCPHLGAHLGYGGRVEGNAIVCPFHGWRIRPSACVSAQAGASPRRGQVRSWGVVERHGIIMAWFDASRREPLWDPPHIAELQSAEWTRLRFGRVRRVRTHVQELAENGIDLGHFAHIHGDHIASVRSSGLAIDGPRLAHRIEEDLSVLGIMHPLMMSRGSLEFSYAGLGMVVVRAELLGRWRVSFLTLIFFTPIEDGVVDVQAAFSIRRKSILTWPLFLWGRHDGERAIDDDMRIMEHKAFLPDPLLSAADGPIHAFRAWAAQFYPGSDSRPS